jgi:hypothetical protein
VAIVTQQPHVFITQMTESVSAQQC